MADAIGMLFFKDKQLRLLLALANGTKEWYLGDLAKAADVTYVHTSRFVSKCQESGIVGMEKHGKAKRIFLTDKGKDVAASLQGVIAKINQAAPQPQVPKPQPPPVLPQ